MGTRAPRISVIIPARNEEPCLGAAIACALSADPWEVVVADGGSTDRTREIAAALGARVVEVQPGRARQMNAGAAAASGDVLLFLHADTLLPNRYDRLLCRVLSRPGTIAGAFRLGIDSPRPSLRLVEWLANWRSRALQMPYGDQALFLRREAFDAVGGFADVPAMEDFECVRRLRRAGRVEISPAAVVTSGRRWLCAGVLRTTLLNQLCVVACLAGVSLKRIASWRRLREASDRPPRIQESMQSFRTTETFQSSAARCQRNACASE